MVVSDYTYTTSHVIQSLGIEIYLVHLHTVCTLSLIFVLVYIPLISRGSLRSCDNKRLEVTIYSEFQD